MSWKDNVDIMKSIIMFYNKSKAYEALSNFYDSCAQVIYKYIVYNVFYISYIYI